MFRSIALLAAGVFLLAAHAASAQTAPLDLSSFYHAATTGVGARAWGMGGTQTALADAAEASTWNPAAAAGAVRPAAFAVFAGDRHTSQYDPVGFALPTGPTGSITPSPTTASASGFRAFQFAFPLPLARPRLVAAVTYRRRLQLPGRTEAAYLFRNQSLYRFDYDYSYDAHGTGGFDTVGVTVASDIGHGVRAGATVHRWFGSTSSSYVETYRYSVSNYYGWNGTWNERLGDDLQIEMSGFSVDIGAQFTARDRYFAGIVYRSGTGADVKYSNAAMYQDTHIPRSAAATYSGSGSLTLPGSLGLGFAVRLVPRLTLAVDQAWTFWSNSTLEGYARATALGDLPQPVALSYPTQTAADREAQSDTSRTSAGLEYRLAAGRLQIPLRAGIAYQQPYDNAGSGSFAVTAGAGVRWRGMVFDAAWVRETASGRYTRQSLAGTIGWGF